MVTHAFYDGNCAGVTNSETFSYTAVDIYFTACCAIKQGITGDCIFFGFEIAADRRQYGDTPAAQSFTQVIIRFTFPLVLLLVSRPARGAWVEILTRASTRKGAKKSRPARGAWVEMLLAPDISAPDAVAPRKGRVG